MSNFSQRRTMMVDTQVRPSDVTKFPIIEAMLSVPRESYVPDKKREVAYVSEILALGHARVLLEPRTFAKMLDALDIAPDELVLDLGCGLGYSTAVLARLAEAVVAIEENPEFAKEAQEKLSSNGVDNAAVLEGKLSEGAAQHGPYDAIIIEGAVEQIPDGILSQLKEGGRIAAIFMENALGVVRIGYKIDGRMTWQYSFNGSAPTISGFEKTRGFAL